MSKNRFQKSPLWGWSYNNPKMDQKLTKIHNNLKELDGMLASKNENGKQRRKDKKIKKTLAF